MITSQRKQGKSQGKEALTEEIQAGKEQQGTQRSVCHSYHRLYSDRAHVEFLREQHKSIWVYFSGKQYFSQLRVSQDERTKNKSSWDILLRGCLV